MKNEIFNNNGELSFYGLACGYIQRKENNETYKELYKEHNVYNVRSGTHGTTKIIWESFDSSELTKARKFYNSIKI